MALITKWKTAMCHCETYPEEALHMCSGFSKYGDYISARNEQIHNKEYIEHQLPWTNSKKKPFTSDTNRVMRLNFAKEYLDKLMSFLGKYFAQWWASSRFLGVIATGIEQVKWSLNQQKYVTLKHGWGHVMVWGCLQKMLVILYHWRHNDSKNVC